VIESVNFFYSINKFDMKRLKTIILSILVTFLAVYADAVIIEFSGEPSQDKIILTWKTGQENDIDLFIVERSTNNKEFTKIGEVASKGSNSNYEFIDSDFTEVKSIYYYRLRIRNVDGTFQLSESITVILKISSFAKTWGSIKALFQ
jgi:hypothetical protein